MQARLLKGDSYHMVLRLVRRFQAELSSSLVVRMNTILGRDSSDMQGFTTSQPLLARMLIGKRYAFDKTCNCCGCMTR